MPGKHAYMIMAHKSDLTFYTLLAMLDHPRNDIFLHMDIKNNGFDPKTLEGLLKYSGLYLTKRISVTWGGYSQIQVKIDMLEKAREVGKYDYCHFISAQDLPIKSQDSIHAFFDAHQGREFVNYESETFGYEGRVRNYWLFQEAGGRWNTVKGGSLHLLDRASVWVQGKLGIWRNPQVAFQKGETWASITGDFGDYIWKNRENTKPWFQHTLCGDEVWFQTLLDQSPFRENLYHPAHDDTADQTLRLIDWKRGDPYVFRMADFDSLCESKMLWARKFDPNVDAEVIRKLKEKFGKKE